MKRLAIAIVIALIGHSLLVKAESAVQRNQQKIEKALEDAAK